MIYNLRRARVSLLFIFGILPLLSMAGCESQQISIPTSFTSYETKEGTFVCEYPEGWEAKGGGGKHGPLWAKFTSGAALIHIKASTTGSLMSDAMGGRNADNAALTPQDAPVHKIHMTFLRSAQEQHNDYTELPGNPTVLDSRLGPARLSEFTATTSFGTALHGYRATIIGHNKGVSITCTCPESEWAKVKPAFDHLLSSFKRGTPP